MADRDPLRQQAPKFRDLGSGVKLYKLPLLPYERQLIETLGCSEKEYRRFAYLASKRGAARPAEYAHIPDIQAMAGPLAGPAIAATYLVGAAAKSTTTVVLINVAVGIALTAASVLLAPKPKGFDSENKNAVRRRTLGSVVGQDRFSPTFGFDTQAELADYASPIPIVFGKWDGTTGGIVASPQLVWSRAFSLGSQQAVKQMFVLGEQGLGNGIDKPDLNGIFLGSTPLDAIYEHLFAFYWKPNSNSPRIKAADLAYGTRNGLAAGDIQVNDDIFLCPTGNGLGDTGFSGARSGVSNISFGCHSPIPNGTNYRVNWRTIAIPHLEDQPDDPGNRLLTERMKVAGDYGFVSGDRRDKDIRAQGQRGTGRNYGRRMGITALNNIPVTDSVESPNPTETREVSVGDTAVFTIAPGELPEDTYYIGNTSTSVSDINSAIDSARRSADDYLQMGETVMIGRTAWKVIQRTQPIWQKDLRQDIVLECIETFGTSLGAHIGLISERMLARGIYNDDDGTTNQRDGLNMSAGAGYYPLMRVNFGVVRNTRPCEVTEVGIRSQVWNKANGLANFQTIPSPNELKRAERARISMESGTMTTYMRRTSVWTVWLRPSGTQSDGTEYEWKPIGEQFCITGETAQDQYNFLRFKHPELNQYEFKFVPKSGADIARHSPDEEVFIRLDAKINQMVAKDISTDYGVFQVSTVGREVTALDIKYNPEMVTNPFTREGNVEYSLPSAVEVESYLPDEDDFGAQAATVGFHSWIPDGYSEGRRAAAHYELFGQAGFMGNTASAQRTVNLGDGRSITLQFNGVVNDQHPTTHPYYPGWYQWSFSSINVVASTGGFNTSQVFNVSIPISPGSPRNAYGLASTGVRLVVLSTTGPRPLGRQSAWEYELLGDPNQYAIGETKVATFEADSSSGGYATIVATGLVTVTSADREVNFPGNPHAWDVTYTIDPLGTYGDWEMGALMENQAVVSASSPFREIGSYVGIQLRVLSLTTAVLPPGFTGERFFEYNSQVTDISLYGNLLTKSNESSPEHAITYINEFVSNPVRPNYEKLTLCGLALKSSRNFSSLDQLRVWLPNGIPVKRFLPGESGSIGPSNNFVDLVYHLLTDETAGVGNVVSAEMIRAEDFPATAQFLSANGLLFNGAIDSPTNIRQFISNTAPFFLCNFVISDGKFSLVPALPAETSGSISQRPLQIKQLFTAGNILKDSYNVEYLSSEERKDFQAVIRYREQRHNQLPEEKTLVVRFAEAGSTAYPVESFDMTQYCTSRAHAFLVAKYFLSLRRRVTHTVKFRTSPFGLSLAPGDYIRVVTEASPYQSANNGTIGADGTIVSATELEDGDYPIAYFGVEDDDVTSASMKVADGKAVDSDLYNKLFTVTSTATSSNVYMVEQLTLGEDGMVDVVATEFPATEAFNSLIAMDVLTDPLFVTEG